MNASLRGLRKVTLLLGNSARRLMEAHLEGLPPPDVAAVKGALVGHLALGAVQGLVLGRLLAPRRRGMRVTCSQPDAL